MISKLFSPEKLSKSSQKKFIPFVNQRNFMGSLLSENVRGANKYQRNPDKDSMAMIENIKKSTKEYLFEKKYNKMVQKLKNIEESMQKKDVNYDEEVQLCLQILVKNTFNDFKRPEEKFYIEKYEEMGQRVKQLKSEIDRKRENKGAENGKKKRCKTLKLQEQFEQNEQMRTTKTKTVMNKLKTQMSQVMKTPKIRKQIFKDVGNRSGYMTDFTNQGMKYKHMIDCKKINPWKRWYKTQEVQLFPGERVKIKKLQKSIY